MKYSYYFSTVQIITFIIMSLNNIFTIWVYSKNKIQISTKTK